MMAIDAPRVGIFELRESCSYGDQIRVHQFDERAPQEKIEADKRDQRGRIVELSSADSFTLRPCSMKSVFNISRKLRKPATLRSFFPAARTT